MNRRIRVDVITQKKGLFGIRNVVKHRTITVSGREYRQMQQDRKNAAARNEAERLAGLYLLWEEKLAEEYGEDF